MREILEELGDKSPAFFSTDMSGILTVESKIDCFKVEKKIKEKIIDEPWSIRYIRRIIPIQKTSISNLDDISKESIRLASIMRDDETFRITIEKRNSDLSSKEIITKIAKEIPNVVSLEQPTWIILIQILGNQTGISVLRKNDVLSVENEKRKLSE